MAGFRDFLLEKYIDKIHPHGYTVRVRSRRVKMESFNVMNKVFILRNNNIRHISNIIKSYELYLDTKNKHFE